MRSINFSEIYTLDYDLCDLFAMRQHWKENAVFRMTHPRSTSCLLYFCGCSGEFTKPGGRQEFVPMGAVVYIPEGSQYTWRFFDCQPGVAATVLIEFGITVLGDRVAAHDGLLTVKQSADPITAGLFSDAVDAYSTAVVSPSAIRSVVYRLLTEFSQRERRHGIKSREFSTIARGINYLETDPKQEKSVGEIARMCHVSEGTFRRLFRRYSGVSPAEYRAKARMGYAKKLLGLGTMTVAEVAASVGISDPAYFCRVFKKHCGMTPGEYAAGDDL